MTDEIVGIDLGTTNSEIAIYREGRPEVLGDGQGRIILPSMVGLSATGELLKEPLFGAALIVVRLSMARRPVNSLM